MRAGRLARSHLAERAPAGLLVEVVRDVCGIHAQVMGSAELQLAARVEGITQADVRSALWERALAREDLDATRDVAFASGRRARTLDGGATGGRHRRGRRGHCRDRGGAARPAADARGARGRGRRASRPGAAGAARVGLGLVPRRRGCGRSALFRPTRRREGDVRPCRGLARAAARVGAGRGAAGGRAAVRDDVRARRPAPVPRVVGGEGRRRSPRGRARLRRGQDRCGCCRSTTRT